MSSLIQITDKSGQPLQKQPEVEPLDLVEVKEKLAQSKGQTYWRSLEELAEQPGFTEMLHREFPGQAPKDWAPLPRRDFVKLMGAALALAGLSGCAFQPQEKIVPYVHSPEEITPGIPLFYATAMPFMGYGLGLLAESNMGRPTKLEGNPNHPISQGTTDVWAQATLLDLYDPDRSQVIRRNGSSGNWDTFTGEVSARIRAARPRTVIENGEERRVDNSASVAILTETTTSPTQLRLMREIRRQLPSARFVSYEAVNRDNVREGVRLATGQALHPVYHFDRARIIVSLDCDFLLEEPGHVAYSREFIQGRRMVQPSAVSESPGAAPVPAQAIMRPPAAGMNRLYVVESTPTITGGCADHRLPVRASEVEGIARALATLVGVEGLSGAVTKENSEWLRVMAQDMVANRGNVIVVAGMTQPPAVHALAHAMTALLGNSDAITYHEPFDVLPGPTEVAPRAAAEAPTEAETQEVALRNLVQAIDAGEVKTLLFLGNNPVYTAPADIAIGRAIQKLTADREGFTAHFGLFEDETSVLCQWHVPRAHFLETWDDVRALDGTVSLVQPLIQPLYAGAKSPVEMLAAIAGNPNVGGYELVRGTWQRELGLSGLAFDKFWQQVVHDGIIPGTAAPVVSATIAPAFAESLPPARPVLAGLEVNFRPDPTIWDGRWANNGWLQECPKPVSKTVWDNAIFISPNTAHEYKLRSDQEVVLRVGGREVTGAIHMMPGQPDGAITVHLGYGRATVGKIGQDAGFNANLLRTSENLWFAAAEGRPIATGNDYRIARTAHHNLIAPEGKDTDWGDALNPFAPDNDDSMTKVIDNNLAPEQRDDDIDGTHGRNIVLVGTFNQYQKDGHLPTSAKDKKGVPLTYPENPKGYYEGFSGVMDEGAENPADYNATHKTDTRRGEAVPGAEHGEAHGETEHAEAHGEGGATHSTAPSAADGRDGGHGKGHGEGHVDRAVESDAHLEGFPSFYPRNTDWLALKRFDNEELNEVDEVLAKELNRPNMTQQWGMTVDLQSCIGCNACVIACQAENNTAIVGKDQVLMGRGMHWMRIDTYFKGSFENPETYFEPMFCQHCEKAPCAPVCPFNAVMNSPSGVNEQIYNRCVGTKYCENNCPYKVRRFNFLQYSDQQTPVIKLMQNPDVTVRSRGVMEKCTYCIQRITAATWQASKEDRLVYDGEILVACQQSCPTNALVFGDINDPDSAVSQLKRSNLTYGILTEFNTLPRTTYLARIKNPNPAMPDQPAVIESPVH